jgi:peptidoglycan hydrolase-like protein with peptidoglycan-binding domain
VRVGRSVFVAPLLAIAVGATAFASAPAAAPTAARPATGVAGPATSGAVATRTEKPLTMRARGAWYSTATPLAARAAAGCSTGPRQREVESFIKRLGGFGTIVVDGKQTSTDCATIKRFQQRYGISPAAGYAGEITYIVSRRLVRTDTKACTARKGYITFCVDLTHQTIFVLDGYKVIWKPTPTRTGMRGGFQTPAGVYKIRFRNIREWSDPYEVWMPYWQRFYGGMGFHQTTTYLHNSFGSHGCINLLPTDAKKLWSIGKIGTRVYIFGRRPGT